MKLPNLDKRLLFLGVSALALGAAGMQLTGCDDDSAAENAVEEAADNIEDAADDTADAIDDAVDDVQDAADDMTPDS